MLTKVQFRDENDLVVCEATGDKVAVYKSAPDLLEALELCLNVVCFAGWEGDFCAEKARAALKKAKGQ